jgi:hypothetical protein
VNRWIDSKGQGGLEFQNRSARSRRFLPREFVTTTGDELSDAGFLASMTEMLNTTRTKSRSKYIMDDASRVPSVQLKRLVFGRAQLSL